MPLENRYEIWAKTEDGPLTFQGWVAQHTDGEHFGFTADTKHPEGPTILAQYLEKFLLDETHVPEEEFLRGWDTEAAKAHTISVAKGWWDVERNDGEAIALMHSELSEALEAIRVGHPPSSHIPGFSETEEELADVVIRIMDYAVGHGLHVAAAVEAKMAYNESRPHKHGGKKF